MTAGDETIFNQSAFWTRIASPSTTSILIYAGNQVVAELDESGTLKKSYTWGPGIDNLLSLTIYGGTTSVSSTYYPLTDHLGTVHAIADKTGTIIESYHYDAWGRVLGVYDSNGVPLKQSAIGNRYLFHGRRYSWQTGLYNFRARWYDPVTGRWLSKDPIGISGGLNQYAAFGNNPVNARDPEGKRYAEICTASGTAVGGGIVAAASVVVDATTGGINILTTPAEIGAGATVGAVIGAAVGSVIDWIMPINRPDWQRPHSPANPKNKGSRSGTPPKPQPPPNTPPPPPILPEKPAPYDPSKFSKFPRIPNTPWDWRIGGGGPEWSLVPLYPLPGNNPYQSGFCD